MTYVKFNQPTGRNLDSFFDSFLNEVPSFKSNNLNFPPVNITDTKDNYELEFNVPGRNKEDFKITVDKNILTVSFDKKSEVKDENRKQIKNEFSLQSFKRSFTLDEKIESEKTSAFEVRLPQETKLIHVLPLTLTAPAQAGTLDEQFTVTIAGSTAPVLFKVYGKILPGPSSAPTSTSAARISP